MPRAFWLALSFLALCGLVWVASSFQTEDVPRITGVDVDPSTSTPVRPHRAGSLEAPSLPSVPPSTPSFVVLDATTLQPLVGAQVWLADASSSTPRILASDGSGRVPRPSAFPALIVVRAPRHRLFAAELDAGDLDRGIALRRSFDLEVAVRTTAGRPARGVEVVYIPPPPRRTAPSPGTATEADETVSIVETLLSSRRPDEALTSELTRIERDAHRLEDLAKRLDPSKDCRALLEAMRKLTRSGRMCQPMDGDPRILKDARIPFPRAEVSDASGKILFSGLLPFGKFPPAHLGLKHHHVVAAKDEKGDLAAERKLMRRGPAVELVALSHPPGERTLKVDLRVATTAEIRGVCGFDGHGGRGTVELRRIGEGKTADGRPYRRIGTVQFHAPDRLEAFRFENVLPGSYIIEAWWESGPREFSVARREAVVAGDEVVDLGRLLPESDAAWPFTLRVYDTEKGDVAMEPTPDDVDLLLLTDLEMGRPKQPPIAIRLRVPLGAVTILGLPPQSHTVTATILREPPGSLTWLRTQIEKSQRFDPNEGVNIVFRLVKKATVRMHVRLPRPLTDPSVYCWIVGPTLDLQTSINLVPVSRDDPTLLVGTKSCQAWGDAGFFARFTDDATGSYLAVSRDLRSLPDRWELQASPGVALRGRLLDTQGRPLANVLLHFELEWTGHALPRGTLSTVVDAEGRFHIQGLPPEATVRFESTASLAVRTPSSGTRTIDVVWTEERFRPLPIPPWLRSSR